jgi:hypothetical protein
MPTAQELLSTIKIPGVVKSAAPAATSTAWVWPTIRTNVSQQPSSTHEAIDIAWQGALNAPVFAPHYGTIQAIKNQPQGYGTNVRIVTPEGFDIVLGHLNALVAGLHVGQVVQAGETVGLLGSTGNSTGPHLHFEVRQPGYTADTFLPGHGSAVGAIDPTQFYQTVTVPSVNRVTPDTTSFSFSSPTIPQTKQNEAASSKQTPEPSSSVVQLGAIGMPGGTTTAQAQAAINNPTQASSSGTSGDIRVASTPVGNITIPKPGIAFVTWALVGVGVLIILIGLFMLAQKPGAALREHGPGILPAKTQAKVVQKVTGVATSL